ncbi:MAG TPA: DUF6247 family protein [Streptosporangiaceae bacterium]
MTAQPAYESDPDDPIEIMHILPEEFHAQFRAEYAAAVEGARHPEQYRRLQEVLRLWRLRAMAYSDPGYAGRLATADGHTGSISAMQLIPGWSDAGQQR